VYRERDAVEGYTRDPFEVLDEVTTREGPSCLLARFGMECLRCRTALTVRTTHNSRSFISGPGAQPFNGSVSGQYQSKEENDHSASLVPEWAAQGALHAVYCVRRQLCDEHSSSRSRPERPRFVRAFCPASDVNVRRIVTAHSLLY
jgi:hypothetical protein